jgi:hypothetical protein
LISVMSTLSTIRKLFALLALTVLGAAPVCAAGNPLLGKWEVVEAVPAPWAAEKERPALAAEANRAIKMQITFAPTEVITTHKGLACKAVEYEQTEYSPDALFRGSLPEPNQDSVAVSLGFRRGDVKGVDVTCDSDSFSYHFRDANTALTALDNIIYTLKRR